MAFRNCILLVGVIGLWLGLLLAFIASVATGWSYFNHKYLEHYYEFGLYRFCEGYKEVDDHETCGPIEDPKDYLRATQAFVHIGVFLAFVAALMSLYHKRQVARASASKTQALVIMVLCQVAVGLLTLGVIIYGASYESDLGDDYSGYVGGAYSCCIVGSVFLAIAGALVYISYNPNKILAERIIVQQVPSDVGPTINVNNYVGAQPSYTPAQPPPQQPYPPYVQHPFATAASGQPPVYPAYGQPYPTGAVSGQPLNPAFMKHPYATGGVQLGQPENPFVAASTSAADKPPPYTSGIPGPPSELYQQNTVNGQQ